MDITLTLASADADEEELQQLTRQLCHDLCEEAGVDAQPATRAAEPGARAIDLPAWGQIVIAAIGSGGTVVALVNVLSAWMQRKKSLVLKTQDKDGNPIEISAENQSPAELTALLQALAAAPQFSEKK